MTKRDLERVARAGERAREALKTRDDLIRQAHPQHTIRAIAQAVGLSHGRVGQIVRQREEKP